MEWMNPTRIIETDQLWEEYSYGAFDILAAQRTLVKCSGTQNARDNMTAGNVRHRDVFVQTNFAEARFLQPSDLLFQCLCCENQIVSQKQSVLQLLSQLLIFHNSCTVDYFQKLARNYFGQLRSSGWSWVMVPLSLEEALVLPALLILPAALVEYLD